MCDQYSERCHDTDECQCPGFKMGRFIQPCILLLLHEKSSHGYELMERLGEFGFHDNLLDPGGLYRNLRKMEDEGWVNSEWQTEGSGPAKRLYLITREGEESLHGWAVHIRNQMKRLQTFLEQYEKIYPGNI